MLRDVARAEDALLAEALVVGRDDERWRFDDWDRTAPRTGASKVGNAEPARLSQLSKA